MPAVYSGFDLGALEERVEAIGVAADLQAAEIMSTIVNKAGAMQRTAIAAAVTKTGEERVRTGGKTSKFHSVSPGRVDSGLMINTVTAQTVEVDGGVVGTWGWVDPEDYFLYQDWGTDDGHIPAAHSLFNTFVVAREELFAAVEEMAGTGGVNGVV